MGNHPIISPPRLEPGVGKGWTRLADAVARELPVEAIARIWVFPPMRRDEREWGTAVIALANGEDRLTVHTARYLEITRGRKRGQGRVEVEFAGAGPPDTISDVLRGVQERTGDTEPPVEVSPTLWYPPDDDEPPAEA